MKGCIKTMNKDIKTSETPRIIVGNVRSKIEHIPLAVANLLAKQFSVKVPNYWFSPKYKSGQWDGTQKFFLRPANTFPTGLLGQVVKTLQEEYEITPEIIDQRSNAKDYLLAEIPENYQISDSKTARDYQVSTINSLISNTVLGIPFMRGVVNIATNGGKTSVAISVIKELYSLLKEHDTVFLFVTHSKEIAFQAKKSIETDLGIEVGFIGDGKWQPELVTVAIVTTLYKRLKKPEYKKLVDRTIGFVADECHHSSSTSWYEVFNTMNNAVIRIGLTGTVDKKNPVNEMRLYSCTGDIISKISNDYLIEKGFSAKPVCIMFTITTPELEGEAYSDAYSMGIVESDERLDVIAQICEKETNSNNTVLILVEHIDHGQFIEEALEHLHKRVFFTNGTLSSERRQELLDNLKSGDIDVLISTAVLDEGVDVSGINAVIYARGGKSVRKLLQGLGRGLRKKEDGSKLRFYDFIDDMCTALLQHSLYRYETLKAEKFTVKALDIDKYMEMSWEEIEHE